MKNSNKVVCGATIILLSIYMLRLLPYRNELYILHDEFGYWAIAAKYAGYSWDGMMQNSLYYSMGYSFFLIPLFWTGWEASILYKCAIIGNAILVIGAYFIALYIGSKLFPEHNESERVIFCGIIFLYPAITMQINYAWGETLLMFLFWVETFFIYKFSKTKKIIWGGIACLVGILMYYVHQRTIGIVISCLLVVALIIFFSRDKFEKKTIINFSLWVLSCVIVWIVLFKLKEYNMENVFMQSKILDVNNLAGQIPKLKSIFSLTGILNLIYSIIGKLYYFGVSTLLIGPVALILLLKELYVKVILLKKIQEEEIIKIFWILSFGAMIVIAGIFAIHNYSAEKLDIRIDSLFYGRYFEHTVGPILLLGLYDLKKIRKQYKVYIYVISLFSIIALITTNLAKKIRPTGKVEFSTPGFNYFFWLEDNYPRAIIYGTLVITLLFTCIIFLGLKNRYKYAILIIAGMWAWQTNSNDKIIKNRELENQKYVYTTVEYLREKTDLKNIAYVYSSKDSNIFLRYAYYLQFNLYKYDFEKIESDQIEKEDIKTNTIYIVMQDSSLLGTFENNCKCLYSNSRVNLFHLEDDF